MIVKNIEIGQIRAIIPTMTTLEEQALKLPKIQKLCLMETIWTDLIKEVADFDPPTWHIQALDETERRIAEGKEAFEDWKDAKQKLRDA